MERVTTRTCQNRSKTKKYDYVKTFSVLIEASSLQYNSTNKYCKGDLCILKNSKIRYGV